MKEGEKMGGDAKEHLRGALSPDASEMAARVELGQIAREIIDALVPTKEAVQKVLGELADNMQGPVDIVEKMLAEAIKHVDLYRKSLGEKANNDLKLRSFEEQLRKCRDDIEARKKLAA